MKVKENFYRKTQVKVDSSQKNIISFVSPRIINAENYLRRAINADNRDEEIQLSLIDLFLKMIRYEEAEQCFMNALIENPSNVPLLSSYISFLKNVRENEELSQKFSERLNSITCND